MPSWEYDWDTFPVAWFGAKRSAYLDEKELADLANFPLVLFGWQDLQLETNYTNLLAAQEEQARQVKVLYPDKPVFVYIGFNGAQPYYAAEKRYFDDDDRYHDFFFRNATGGHWPPSSGYKCNAEGDKEKLPACRNYAWNFFNASARAAFLAVAEDLVASDTSSNGAHKFDGVFFDGACHFFSSKHWQGASNLPADTSDEAIRVIWIGLVSKLCAICAAHNKYPMFNLHLDALNFNLTGPTTGNEATLLGSLNGQGLFRYNEGVATTRYHQVPRQPHQRTALLAPLASARPGARQCHCRRLPHRQRAVFLHLRRQLHRHKILAHVTGQVCLRCARGHRADPDSRRRRQHRLPPEVPARQHHAHVPRPKIGVGGILFQVQVRGSH